MTEVVKIVERRVRPRIETKVKVKIEEIGGETLTYSGNLSKSGVFLETTEPIADVGEKLSLQLRLANATENIKIQGRVARVVTPNKMGQAPGTGIEFLKVETRHARSFEKLIDRLLDARGIGCRRYPRVQSQVLVELKTKADVREVTSENISKGGLFLRMSAEGIVLGDTLNVVILHPTAKRKFSIDAEVVHIRKGDLRTVNENFVEGVGVQFLEMTPARRNDMSLFLRGILAAQKRASPR